MYAYIPTPRIFDIPPLTDILLYHRYYYLYLDALCSTGLYTA